MLLTAFLILAVVVFWMLTAGWDRVLGNDTPADQPTTTERKTMDTSDLKETISQLRKDLDLDLEFLKREAREAFSRTYAACRAALVGSTSVGKDQHHPLALEAAKDAHEAYIAAHAPAVPPADTTPTA